MRMNEENKSLKAGEKYLTIEIDLGLFGKHKVSVFKQEKTNANQPDFKGKNVVVWINKKKIQSNDEPIVKEEFI